MTVRPTDIDIIALVLRRRSHMLKKIAGLTTGRDVDSVVTRGTLELLAREFRHLADAFVTAQQATRNLNAELKKEEADEQS